MVMAHPRFQPLKLEVDSWVCTICIQQSAEIPIAPQVNLTMNHRNGMVPPNLHR